MTYAPRIQLKALLLALLVCVCSAQLPAARGQAVTAEAKVNSTTKAKVELGQQKFDGEGVSIAAAKVFHGEEQFRVSRRPKTDTDKGHEPANADEEPRLRSLFNSPSDTDLFRRNTKPGDNPERFKEIKKVIDETTLLAETDKLMNAVPLEEAKATATQRLFIDNTGGFVITVYAPQITLETKVAKAGETGAGGKAAALGINRDPLPIEWNPASERTVTVDLSEVSLTVGTSGTGASAFALIAMDASFINGTLDIALPEDDATPLYDFSLSALSQNGGPPVFEVTFDTFGNDVSDSLGNQGIDNVRNGLLSQLALLGDGSLGFQSPYSFTVRVPEEPLQSVLFLRDLAAASAEVEVVPEPTTFTLLAVGILSLSGYGWRRWKRAA